eukprot:3119549-Amphidinium_carterae.1
MTCCTTSISLALTWEFKALADSFSPLGLGVSMPSELPNRADWGDFPRTLGKHLLLVVVCKETIANAAEATAVEWIHKARNIQETLLRATRRARTLNITAMTSVMQCEAASKVCSSAQIASRPRNLATPSKPPNHPVVSIVLNTSGTKPKHGSTPIGVFMAVQVPICLTTFADIKKSHLTLAPDPAYL